MASTDGMKGYTTHVGGKRNGQGKLMASQFTGEASVVREYCGGGTKLLRSRLRTGKKNMT
jgi:hypothetical protein